MTWKILNNPRSCIQRIRYKYIYKIKFSRYRPGVAQRMGRGIALLFHDCGTRRGWVVSSTPRPHFTPGKDPVPILQEAGWAPGPVWTGEKSRSHRDSIPDIYIIQDIRKSLYAFVDFNTMWNDIKNFTHLKTTGRILSIRWFGLLRVLNVNLDLWRFIAVRFQITEQKTR